MLCTGWLAAAPALVLEASEERFRFNRGAKEKVEVGQVWWVYRSGQAVGKARVEATSEFSSEAVMTEGGAAQVGDLVRLSPLASPAAISPPPASNQPVRSEDLDEVRERYLQVYKGSSQSISFVTGQQPSELFAHQQVRLEVQVTFWQESLVERYANYLAAREGMGLAQTLALQQKMVSEKAADRYSVFEVRVRNAGQKEAALAPFKWRMYLIDGQKPLGAVRYDRALDSTLGPGQEVLGAIYFPKLSSGSDKALVAFEQMFGDRGTLEFEIHR